MSSESKFWPSLDDKPLLLVLSDLRSGRTGLTKAFASCLEEAASVCLNERGHGSPTAIKIAGSSDTRGSIEWSSPSAQSLRCWNDDEYTTEHGAYGLAALLVERMGFEILDRSKKKTGFDFWIGRPNVARKSLGEEDALFQGLTRLEVSGIRKGAPAQIDARVRSKLKQTNRSDGRFAAFIVVVEFGHPLAMIQMK